MNTRISHLAKLLQAGIVWLLLPCCSSELTLGDPVQPPPKGDPGIFKVYRRDGDSVMAGGWSSGMNLSGVSFDQRQTATLVSRRHVVMANHFQRGVGSKLVFHDRRGKFLERTLVKTRTVHGDVAVGLLSEPVPANYRVYPLPAAREDPSFLIGRPVMVSDQNRRLFFHKVRTVNRFIIAFEYDVADTHGWGKKLIKGDSGNPSFLIDGQELVLVETHTSGGPGAGPFYGSAIVQEKLRKVMAEMDPRYTFRTVNVR